MSVKVSAAVLAAVRAATMAVASAAVSSRASVVNANTTLRTSYRLSKCVLSGVTVYREGYCFPARTQEKKMVSVYSSRIRSFTMTARRGILFYLMRYA